MQMRSLCCALGVTALSLGTPLLGTTVRAEIGETTSPGEGLFAQYCSSCHGSDLRGVTAADASSSGPDLTHLADRFQSRRGQLPMPPLVEFVTSVRRPGAQRICGERVFARLPTSRFREHAERWIVRSALDYVATRQDAE